MRKYIKVVHPLKERKYMKAILVIDVPDNTEFDKDYRLTGLLLANEYAENVGIEFKDARLKPMPKHYPSTSNPHRIEYLKKLGMTEKEQHYYELGHDDCIDEILGETE